MYMDNIGAVFLVKSQCSTKTKYIDVKHHYMQELMDENIIKLVFVRTDKNLADNYAKNILSKRFIAYFNIFNGHQRI